MTSGTLKVRVSADGKEVDIEGDEAAFACFANALARGAGEISMPGEFDPTPYDSTLIAIRVAENSSGKVLIQVDPGARALEISGSREYLDIFAKNVAGFAREASPGYHQHIEYYEDLSYVAESAVPIVIVKARSQPT
jgi:hypothetical protein